MEFANDPIARRIREAAGRGTLSHALLFSGSGDRIAVAQYAAAAADSGAVHRALASAIASRADGHSDAERGD